MNLTWCIIYLNKKKKNILHTIHSYGQLANLILFSLLLYNSLSPELEELGILSPSQFGWCVKVWSCKVSLFRLAYTILRISFHGETNFKESKKLSIDVHIRDFSYFFKINKGLKFLPHFKYSKWVITTLLVHISPKPLPLPFLSSLFTL